MPAHRPLTKKPLFLWAALALLLGLLPQCHPVPDPRPGERGQWVNPFVGTGGVPWACGMLFPGATTPFGLVRLSPDTSYPGGFLIENMGTAGYYYGHTHTWGFSHTRLSGTGAVDGGHFRITPRRGAVDPASRLTDPLPLDHRQEKAAPGYYGVWLQDPGVLAELSATAHVGVHRYTFSPEEEAHLVLDATSHLAGGRATEGRIEVLPETGEVVGEARLFGSFSSRYGGLKGYFVARFSPPFNGFGTWRDSTLEEGRAAAEGDDVGADLRFSPDAAGKGVEVKLAVSFVSLEGARANLEAEAGGLDFDAVHTAAVLAWENALGRLRFKTGSDDVRTVFSTALYHAMIMPTLFTDVTGEYLGFHEQVGRADGFTYRTDLSLWDTFRSEHPLLLFVAPEVQRDSLKSLIRMARIGGTLPRWPSGAGYTGSMFGTPADMVIAESFLKGITDFEVDEAYEFMKLTALGPPPPGARGRDGIGDCLAFGYCPADRMELAVSRTLEYAWADASIGGLAEALGHPEDAAFFRDRSLDYRLTWNPETAYFQPRNADGTWVEPFFPNMTSFYDQLFGGIFVDDYCEGSPRQWRWTAPHDPGGLLALFGDPGFFVSELETFLEEASPNMGGIDPGPAYWHGNQHDMHAIYLFNEAVRPDLTQKWVRWALTNRYGPEENGLDGNDDGGTLSSWYVLSAMGIYPVAGSDRYWIGAPIVDRAEVVPAGSTTLTVIAENQGPDHPYVQKVSLNGVRLCAPFVRHGELLPGSTLVFEMGPEPAPGGGFACP
jgi:predicted alpha-1,2-mannosidase